MIRARDARDDPAGASPADRALLRQHEARLGHFERQQWPLETIDLLKINCEGSEYEILETCTDAEFERIASIRLEYHNMDYPNKNGDSLARFLEARGYKIQRFSQYRGSSGFIWADRPKPLPSESLHGGGVTVSMLIASASDTLITIL